MQSTFRGPTRRGIRTAPLDGNLVAEARELGINVPDACERGLETAIAEARADRWMDAHRDMVESYIRYVGNYLPPLDRLRRF